MLFGAGLAFGIPASAGTHPTPTPTVTPTVTPVVNPFANCRFTFSRITTFDPNTGAFVRRFDPAIVCDTPYGRARVYDLVR
jgi:hypothetical protein